MSIGALQAKFITATARILASRTAGVWHVEDLKIWNDLGPDGARRVSDLNILNEVGFADFNEYWSVALSQEVDVKDFIDLLYTHLIDPQQFADELHLQKLPLQMHITRSLREAQQNRENWFIGTSDDLMKLRLHPRKAAQWLLQRPLYADRVPLTLRDFLNGVEIASTLPKRPRATRTKVGAVAEWLRKRFPPDGLPPVGHHKGKLLKELTPSIGVVSTKTLSRAIQQNSAGQSGQIGLVQSV